MSAGVPAARRSTGPRHPVTTVPARRPGSVRRTTSVDQRWSDPGGPQTVLALGRDVHTRPDGSAEVVDQAEVRIEVIAGLITGIETAPSVSALDGLVGGSISKGLRLKVDSLVGDHRVEATVLHQLLDDLPMANLISSYGSSRERPDFRLPDEAAASMTDLCSGWRAGGTMLDTLARTGVFPIPIGPTAPDLTSPDDPFAGHDLPPMAPRSIRRRRRIDVLAGDPLLLDVHFRDSHVGTGEEEDVLHEYLLTGSVDPADLTVRSVEAEVRVLPWPECPGAAASASRIVGEPVARLRRLVTAGFTGTSTCTHLNDVLRSLAGVTALARHL